MAPHRDLGACVTMCVVRYFNYKIRLGQGGGGSLTHSIRVLRIINYNSATSMLQVGFAAIEMNRFSVKKNPEHQRVIDANR